MCSTVTCRAFATAIAGLLCLGSNAVGEAHTDEQGETSPRVRLGASLRYRYEDKHDLKFGAAVPGNDENYHLGQLRIRLDWQPTANLSFVIEGQDARILGQEAINEDATPNIFADSLDLHRAYADVSFAAGELPGLVRVGRQKLNLGAQRLVASLEWVNTARVWDAVRLTLGSEKKRTVDAFSSRLVAVDPNSPNDWAKTPSRLMNSDFHGVYLTDWELLPRTRFESYGLLRRDRKSDDEVATLGVRFVTTFGSWEVDGEFPWQFGTYGGVDHEAFAVHLGGGRTWSGARESRLGVAYNFATGDSADERSHRTFDNLYPLNHAYYGYMDLFSWQNMHNAELTWKIAPRDDVSFRLAYQDFWLAEPNTDAWYNAGAVKIRQAGQGQSADSHVGRELDLTVRHRLSLGRVSASLEAGYSYFFSDAYVRDTGPSRDADFAYLQTRFEY